MSFWQQLGHSLGFLGGVSDEELMSRVKNRDDRTAFRALFERHYRQVYARLIKMGCNQQIAEEIVQDVFLSVYRSRTTYRDEAAFRPWVTVMARHRLIDFYRAKHGQWDEAYEVDQIEDETSNLEDEIIKRQEKALLDAGLQKLRLQERELIVLWMDDFSYEEIADIVGKSVSAVKFALHQAKKSLLKQKIERGAV